MGVLYSLLVVDERMIDYLRERGVMPPAGTSLPPTPARVRRAMEDVPGWKVDIRSGNEWWQATVAAVRADGGIDYALLNAAGYRGDEAEPASLYFEKGDGLMNLVVAERIAAVCGPLALLGDHSGEPVVVTAGADVPALYTDWLARIDAESRRFTEPQ